MFFRRKKNDFVPDGKTTKAYHDSRGTQKSNHICDAPFKSLLFIPTGEMMVCHYNRGYKLGTYPENTIEDVWFGSKLKLLRDKMRLNDFSQGCHRCFDNIKNGRFASPGPSSYDGIPENGSLYPALMEFQLSNQCNLECVMCSGEYSSGIRAKREKLPPCYIPWDDAFVTQLKPFIPHLRKAYFTGGEPFIIPLYPKIWKIIEEVNPKLEINVSTNASYLDNSIKAIIEKGCFNFTVSIDSIAQKNYENIRKNATLEETMRNIAWLHDYSKRRGVVFSIKFVMLRDNISDIPELYNYFNSKNIQLIPKTVDLPFKHSLFSTGSEELEASIKMLEAILPEHNTEIQQQNRQRLNESLMRLKSWMPLIQAREQNTTLIQADTSALREMLTQKLLSAVASDVSLNSEERHQITLQIPSLMAAFEEGITESAKLRPAYFAFVVQTPELILDEIKRGNTDKLVARFRGEMS